MVSIWNAERDASPQRFDLKHNVRFMSVHSSLLKQFTLLKNLPAEVLEPLALAANLRTFAKREVLTEKNSPSQYFSFLLEGRLQATDFTLDGKEVCLYFVDEGRYFGEIALLDGGLQPEIMIAYKKSQVVSIPAHLVRPLIVSEPLMTETIMLGLTEKIRHQSEQRQILSINNPLQRVCAQLLLLLAQAKSSNTPKMEGLTQVLAQAPTHQELSMMVNLSRETVTRVFQVLQSQGALDRASDQLLINTKLVSDLANGPD
jgi:CRP-like cAMP-binding protein